MALPPLPAGSPGTTTTFGSDFSGTDDLDPNWTFLQNSPTTPNAEDLAFAQALVRRYSTTRGGLWYDPAYGTNLCDYIGSSTPIASAIADIQAEALKDQRVANALASITVDNAGNWIVSIIIYASRGGSFNLTLSVSQVTVSLISFQPTGQT